MRLIQSLNKSWKKIDWQKVLSGQIEPLPEQFKVVRDRKSTRLNSSHTTRSRMPSSA